MSERGYDEEELQNSRPAKRGGGGSSDQSADSSGGRSTGWITGFSGGTSSGSGSSAGGKNGAVVKANYAKAGTAKSSKSVKASSRYYTTRENERGESMERESFSKDRAELSRDETYERLERADQEHEYHTRVVLSPGTDREAEGVDLKEYTREVMREIERQDGGASWVAVEHGHDTAHTERAHVHVIVSTDEKLSREDLEKLRDHASRSWDEARDHQRTLERDPGIEREIKDMSRALEERDRERSTSREPEAREQQESGREQENSHGYRSQERENSSRDPQPTLPDRPPERSHEHDFGRDGGRSR